MVRNIRKGRGKSGVHKEGKRRGKRGLGGMGRKMRGGRRRGERWGTEVAYRIRRKIRCRRKGRGERRG